VMSTPTTTPGQAPPTTAAVSAPSYVETVGETVGGQPLLKSVGQYALGAGIRRLIFSGIVVAVTAGAAYATSLFGLAGDGDSTGSTPQITLPSGLPTDLPSGLPTSVAPTPKTATPPRLLTKQGFVTFRNAVDAKFGSERFVSAVVYPGYAMLQLPIKGDPAHSESWYYNGTFRKTPVKIPLTSAATVANLRSVRVSKLVSAIARAPKALNVHHPTSTYLIFEPRNGIATMSVYVIDAANGTGYWTMRLDGTTTFRYRNP
jgi:hypothetical protein